MKSQWFSPIEQFGSLQIPNTYYHYPTQSIIESSSMRVLTTDYETVYNVAEWRFLSQYPIVKIYHAQLNRQTRQGVFVEVYVQRIQPLSHTIDISLKNTLYLLKTSLIALQKLKDKFGCFDLSDKMIGINNKKQCKVWINECFQKCQILGKCHNQQEMVKKLLALLQQHTYNNLSSRYFFQLAYSYSTSFIKAQQFITRYSYQHSLVMPPFFSNHQNQPFTTQFQNQPNNHILSNNYNMSSFVSFRKSSPKIINGFSQNHKPKISFKYINLKDINNNQRMLKDSKNTMACSSDNDLRSNIKLDLNLISSMKKKLSISLIDKNLTKMTLSSGIVSLICHPSQPQQQTTQYFTQKMIQQGFQKNQWKKNVDELFQCSKNIKDSINYQNQNQIAIMPTLKILQQYGRYVRTSTQEKDQQTQKGLR